MAIDSEQRAALTAKYGIDQPPRLNNPIVNAILDAERITANAHGRDNGPLFDPVWSPDMWARANEAMSTLRNGLEDSSIRVDSRDYDLNEMPDDALAVWAVGSRTERFGGYG